jgi:hypothetical protein
MSVPASRSDFKAYCLRKLGNEVIDIDISDNQAEDRIDEAILYWQDFSTDGTTRQYYKYQITNTDVTNRYITLPSNIIGAIDIFDYGLFGSSTNNMFDIRYQIALNDLYTLTSFSLVPYYMAMEHIQLLQLVLVGKKAIRYNRIQNVLYLDLDWALVQPGQFLIIDCYSVIDPTVYTAMWGDRMLQNLATAYIKRQWGSNLSKYSNIPMLGGTTFNGEKIYQEGAAEALAVEARIRTDYEMQPEPLIG